VILVKSLKSMPTRMVSLLFVLSVATVSINYSIPHLMFLIMPVSYYMVSAYIKYVLIYNIYIYRQQSHWYYQARSYFHYWTYDLWRCSSRAHVVNLSIHIIFFITVLTFSFSPGLMVGPPLPRMVSVQLNSNILFLLPKLVSRFWLKKNLQPFCFLVDKYMNI
jgi:hypothetical protein